MTFLLLKSFGDLRLDEQVMHLSIVLGCSEDGNLRKVLRKCLKYICIVTLSDVLAKTVAETFACHTLRSDGSNLPR